MEQTTGGDPLDFLQRSIDQTQRYVDGVKPDQLGLPTPCTKWTVGDVINHMVRGNAWSAAVIELGSATRPDGDVLGDDPSRAFADSGRAVMAAFRQPGALERTVEAPFGATTGRVFAMIRAIDLLSHALDLAKATGQSTAGLDPALYAPALHMSQASRLATMDRTNSPFAPIKPCPDDAPVWDQFAAFHGRDV